MSLMGHLGELRKRLTYIAIVVVVCVIAAFIEKKYVFGDPHAAARRHAGFTDNVCHLRGHRGLHADPQGLHLRRAAHRPALHPLSVLGLHHARALREREAEHRSLRRPSPPSSSWPESSFGYFVVLPVGLKFMVGYGGEFFNQLLPGRALLQLRLHVPPGLRRGLRVAADHDAARLGGLRRPREDAQGAQVRHPGRSRHRHGLHPQPGPAEHGPHARPAHRPVRVRHLAGHGSPRSARPSGRWPPCADGLSAEPRRAADSLDVALLPALRG